MSDLVVEDKELTILVADALVKILIKDQPKLKKISKKKLRRYVVCLLEGRGAMSDLEIETAIASNHIVCHPLVPENIKGSSIDVTLGRNFYGCDRNEEMDYYNPRDPEDVVRYFDANEPKKAILHEDWVQEGRGKRVPFKNIPLDAFIIVMRPRERILTHTHEFIGILPPGTTQMQARSSVGRNGVSVCIDAGWGDPGYFGRWTMEVYNWNNHKVPLVIGDRIAQLVFYRTGQVRFNYGEGGKYQIGTQLQDLIREWKPEMMLPRSYNDKLVKPRDPNSEPVNFEKILRKSLKKRGLSSDHLDKLAV